MDRLLIITILILVSLFGFVVYRNLTFQAQNLDSNELKIPQEFKDCKIGKGMIDGNIIYFARCESKTTSTVNEFHTSGKTTKHTTTVTIHE